MPSIDDEAWIPTVQETDALLVWGGDVLYLCHWMRQSGLADLLPSLRRETVYMGVSTGSMAASATFSETYRDPPWGGGKALTSEDIVFATPQGARGIHSPAPCPCGTRVRYDAWPGRDVAAWRPCTASLRRGRPQRP